MSTAAVVRRCLSGLTQAQTPLSDADLLSRFVGDRDHEAFSQLVRRHGPVVLAACRRVLGPTPDAEDAFQTTFLALARNAMSIRGAAALPAWLHRAAFRAALRLRSRRRAAAPLSVDMMSQTDPLADAAWRDVRLVLDEELNHLPEKFRAPLVLCLLGGLTRDEAATQLGYSLNTLKRRLEAGRELLRARLLRRGVAPIALAAALLDADGLRAAVSTDLIAKATEVGCHSRLLPIAWNLRASLLATAMIVGLGAVATAVHESQAPVVSTPQSPVAEPAKGKDGQGDPLPDGARLRIGTIRFRDGAGTNQSILSPDGKVLATASEAGVMLFDLATGQRLLWINDSGVPNGYDANYSRFAFSPDGKKIFTIYAPGAISIAQTGAIAAFDAATGNKLATFKSPPVPRQPNQQAVPFDYGYTRLWFPAGAKHLFAIRHGQTVLIDPDSGNEARILDFAADVVGAVPDGVRLFAIPKDSSDVTVHDADGKRMRTLSHTVRPTLLGFDPGMKVVAAAGPKSEVRIWDPATGKVLGDIAIPEKGNSTITALSVTPDLKELLVGMQTGTIARYDIATGKESPALRGHTHYVTGLHFTDAGKSLVSTSWDHAIVRWDLAAGKRLPDAGGYSSYLYVDRSPDGKRIAAVDSAGRVELLDALTGRRVRVLQESGHPGASKVVFARDGGRLVTAHRDAKLRVWETATGKLAREIEVGTAPKERGAWFRGLAISPDGRAVAVSCDGIGTRAFDMQSGKQLWESPGDAVPLAYLPDGRTLLSAGAWNGPALLIRDAATGTVRTSTPPGRQSTNDIAVSPDGRTVATGDHPGMIYLRDPATGAVRKEWQAHKPGEVTWGLSFGPGGIWLASAGDQSIAIWDAATGQLLRRFEGHTSRAYEVRFGSDGRTVLSSSMDLTGYLWDIKPKLGAADARTPAQIWDDLMGEPEAAFRAVWLAAADSKAVAFFGEKLPPPVKPDTDRFKKLVGDLGSEDFNTREAAEMMIAKFGPGALVLARKAREAAESDEVRSRLDRVMKAWTQGAFSPENWRRRRAIVAMELANTAESRALLKRWAEDAPGTVLSDDAAAALSRLGNK